MPIIPLTHVCQYWRHSIVSAPENWARISNGHTELAQLSLERTKAAPLDVHLMFDLKKETFDFLLPHARKIVSLRCVHFTVIEELAQALPNFPKSMPNLQSLGLSCILDTNPSRAIDPFDFSTHTTLRELSLYNVPLYPSILGFRTLTEFDLWNLRINLHVDTILTFLETNQSLERANFDINFEEDSLRRSRRQTPVKCSLRHLMIWCDYEGNVKPLISNMVFQEGATLEIVDYGNGGLTRILSGFSTTRLPGLSSPISMEYQPSPRNIQLRGPDGSFFYMKISEGEPPFLEEFRLFPIAGMRELRLRCYESWVPSQFRLSLFPALEVLVVDGRDTSHRSTYDGSTPGIPLPSGSVALPLSPVLPDSASSPSPKTLAFLDCALTEDFMDKLEQVALDRERHTSGSLHRVVIVSSKGQFPSADSVRRLRKYVPNVEVLEGKELPEDLSIAKS